MFELAFIVYHSFMFYHTCCIGWTFFVKATGGGMVVLYISGRGFDCYLHMAASRLRLPTILANALGLDA